MSKKHPKYRAGLVQFDIKRGHVSANLKTVLRWLTRLAERNVRLAVLPEMWPSSMVASDVDRLVDESETALQEIRRFARKHAMTIVGSSYERASERIYNTAYVVDADGSISGQYRKIHLFSPAGEHINFQAGDVPLVVNTTAGRLGVVICYDLRFPELLRMLCEQGAEILIVPAQWPSLRQDHWNTLLRARAIENQVFVIGCNRTGHENRGSGLALTYGGGSVLIDPWGRTLASRRATAGIAEAEFDFAVIDKVRKSIPVWTDRSPATYKIQT